MPEPISDHFGIVEAVKAHNAESPVEIGTPHLLCLDEKIERITISDGSYFEALYA